MTKLYIIRHAEAEGNLYRRIHGWYDSLITKKGWMQIHALEKRFENIHIDAVYSSDLIRTQMTASGIFLPKKLPLYSDPQLREVGMGIWEDMTWGDAEIEYPQQIKYFTYDQEKWSIPGGECYKALQQRIFSALTEIAENNCGKTVAVVTHGTAIRALIAYINGIPSENLRSIFHCDNTAVTTLTYDGGIFEIESYGDVSHLPEHLQTVSNQTWWKNKDGCDSSNLRYYTPKSAEDFAFINAMQHHPADSGLTYIAAHRDTKVGVLSLDSLSGVDSKTGYITDYRVLPEYMNTRFAPQLIGQAISVFRTAGLEYAAVDVHGDDEKHGFFENYGFCENVPGVMRLDISLNWRKGKNIIYVRH